MCVHGRTGRIDGKWSKRRPIIMCWRRERLQMCTIGRRGYLHLWHFSKRALSIFLFLPRKHRDTPMNTLDECALHGRLRTTFVQFQFIGDHALATINIPTLSSALERKTIFRRFSAFAATTELTTAHLIKHRIDKERNQNRKNRREWMKLV